MSALAWSGTDDDSARPALHFGRTAPPRPEKESARPLPVGAVPGLGKGH
jgi:hypothetical protein